MAPGEGIPLRNMGIHQVDGAISDWLTRAQGEPAHAWHEWSDVGVALLPLGRAFVAPRLPEALVHAAVGTKGPDKVTECLERYLRGPVIYDGRTMGGTYYALMEQHDRAAWRHQDVAPLLGRGTYLGVPRLDRREPPGTHWAVPPHFTGDLCAPRHVADLIARGRERLATGLEQ